MPVQKIQSGVSFTSGLYFSRASNVCFNKDANFVNKTCMKISESGYKYWESIAVPQPIKERFVNNEFIKALAEKFDTFIWFKEIPANGELGNGNIALAKIWWADTNKKAAQVKVIMGISKDSRTAALESMFNKLV